MSALKTISQKPSPCLHTKIKIISVGRDGLTLELKGKPIRKNRPTGDECVFVGYKTWSVEERGLLESILAQETTKIETSLCDYYRPNSDYLVANIGWRRV